MKVLYVITELGGGGAEKILTQTACFLKRQDHDISVLSLQTPPKDMTFPDQLRGNGIPVHFLSASKHDLFLPIKLRKFIRTVHPDLVHSHLVHPNILCRIAMRGMNIPLVNTVHTAENRPGQGLINLLDRMTCKMPSVITAVSRSAAVHYAKSCHLPSERMRVIPNGVEPIQETVKETGLKLLTSLSEEKFDRILCSIGRLDRAKGYALFLQHLATLDETVPCGQRWLLVIFGDGPDRQSLEQTAGSLSLKNIRIAFAGYREDAPQLLNGCDGFFSASLCEGFGLAVAEAMSLGVPIVANRLPALEEICAGYPNVFFYDALADGTGEQMAKAFLQASQAQRVPGKKFPSPQDMANKYSALYAEILGTCK